MCGVAPPFLEMEEYYLWVDLESAQLCQMSNIPLLYFRRHATQMLTNFCL